MTRVLFVVLMVAISACGGSRQAGPTVGPASEPGSLGSESEEGGEPAWVRGEMPDLYDEATHLMVVGRGSTMAEAEADAQARMRAEVLGTESGRPFFTVPDALQEFAFAPGTERYVDPNGQAHVRLIAQRVFVMDRLKAWEAMMGVGVLSDPAFDAFTTSDGPVTDPSAHLNALAATLAYQRANAYVCTRRMVVTTSTCTPANLKPIQKAVEQFGKALQLRPHFADGVPFRLQQGPQAPVSIDVVFRSPGQPPMPMVGLPIAFRGPSGESNVETNGQGQAAWQVSTDDPGAKIDVRFQAEALLGPDASLWASLPAIQVQFRPLSASTARVALHITETPTSKSGRDGLREKLEALGLPKPTDLPEALQQVVGAEPNLDTLRSVANRAQGTIDLVAIGAFRSQFASRMGARSVWHEARGQVTVYDVWSGAKIGPLTSTQRAVAIGERAAASKALGELGASLADEIAKLIEAHYRPGAAAVR